MFARIQKYMCAVIGLSLSVPIFAAAPAASTTSSVTTATVAPTATTPATTTSTAATLSSMKERIDAAKTQIFGSSTTKASPASQASFRSARSVPDEKSLMDDIAPMKLIQSLVRLHEYEKRQETELKELQKTRVVIEKRITQMQARLDQLTKDITGYADTVQNLVKDPQKKAEWQAATTKMYVAVAQSERLKQLLQRYTGTIKKLDASKLATKLVAEAKGGTFADKLTKKSVTTVSKPASAATTSTSTTSTTPVTEIAESAGSAPDVIEPDLATELDSPADVAPAT